VFLKLQKNPAIKGLKKEAILTILGLKILRDKFSENKDEWKLVAGKAAGFLRAIEVTNIQESLDSLEVSYHF
jgi:putative Mn2+ efflux pump MntP